MSDFNDELKAAFAVATDVPLIRNMNLAVSLADDLRRNTPWLGSELGDDLTGVLRRVAVMHRISQACVDGELPFTTEEIPNTTGSCHLLSIRSARFEAHVVRTESPKAFPKDAPIRQDRRATNEPTLFDALDPKIVPLNKVLEEVGRLYAWLSFNANPVGMLTHVGWAMPDANTDKFVAYRDVLGSAMRSATAPTDATPPKPSIGDKIKFRDAIEEVVEKQKKRTE